MTVANNISGNGTVTQLGSGTTILTGANTYTGGTIIAAGTLELGAANIMLDDGRVTLAGGRLSTGAGVDETLGELQVTSSSSRILMGNNVHTLTFASFDPTGFTGLTIDGWVGTNYFPGFNGRIFFTDTGGLSQAVLDNITFTGHVAGAAIINGNELVPVPEPATVLCLSALAFAGVAGIRRFSERPRVRLM
jgi:autotransporter-associated beta strand protein